MFKSTITYLVFAVLYNVTGYSQDSISLMIDSLNSKNMLLDSIKDIEGNTYYSHKFGTQIWLSDNLSTSHFNDGTPILEVRDSATWISTNEPAVFILDSLDRYYYNYYVVSNNKNVCPNGWHIPDTNDFLILQNYSENLNLIYWKLGLGSIYVESSFEIPDTLYSIKKINTGLSFSDQPYGFIFGINGTLTSDNFGYWWIYDSDRIAKAYDQILYKRFGIDDIHIGNISYHVFDSGFLKTNGLSIRCIKD